jgi:hypothetical protein
MEVRQLTLGFDLRWRDLNRVFGTVGGLMRLFRLFAILSLVFVAVGCDGADENVGIPDGFVARPDADCVPRDRKECCGAAVCWVDSCGNPGERVVPCFEGCAAGRCLDCAPRCAGRECGDDGCGGECGECADGAVCEGVVCVCVPRDHKACCGDDICWFDSCGAEGEVSAVCADGCEDGRCRNCDPDCGDAECGDDGCGGECGECAGGACDGLVWQPPAECVAGRCEASPEPVGCEAATPCQDSYCGPTQGCMTVVGEDGASCWSGAFCWVGETCVAGVCTGGRERDCTSAMSEPRCQTATCDESAEGCVVAAANEGEPCDEARECDESVCREGACAVAVREGYCLIDGACFADGANNPANFCQYCDAYARPTSYRSKPDGVPCDDGDPATVHDACLGGVCVGCRPDCTGRLCGGDGCGGSCGECVRGENGGGVCSETAPGTWECVFTCDPGYVDLDGDGLACEYACTTQSYPDVPDDEFEDADCDGIDGSIARSLFVAPPALGGDDSNPGTMTAPLATIDAAITAAHGDPGRAAVLVAAGVYEGPVTIREGVSVHGGYDAAAGWARSAALRATVMVREPQADGAQVGLFAHDIAAPTVFEFIDIEVAANPVSGGSNYGVHAVNAPGLTMRRAALFVGAGGAGSRGRDGVPGPDATGPAAPECPDGEAAGAGGAGGAAGTCDPLVLDGTPGEAGGGPLGGAGGAGDVGCTPGLIGMDCETEAGPGEDGGAGGAGAAGGAESGPGSWDGSFYRPADGSAGEPGEAGSGGGGGGGRMVVPPLFGMGCFAGGSGGAGGAGGCGGSGGGGGAGGGAALGVLVAGVPPRFEAVEVTHEPGGVGGAGGLGAGGGRGAPGERGRPGEHVGPLFPPLDGLEGGAGGDGGGGGDGAPGADGLAACCHARDGDCGALAEALDCRCVPRAALATGRECGAWDDGCGGVTAPAGECGEGLVCNADGRCVCAEVGASCDDGRFCTTGTTCQRDRTCGGGIVRDCGEARTEPQCQVAHCDLEADTCVIAPANEGQPCAGGSACGGTERCENGVCQECYDADPHTVDTCEDNSYDLVAAGDGWTVAHRRNGETLCWGGCVYFQVGQPPPGLFIQLAAGMWDYNCGIRPDLTLFCWGREGEAVPAYGQFQKVAVSGASEAAGCAIRTDRTLVCWGGGYLDDAPTGTFRDIATGRQYACAVRSDGSVTCWGATAYGSGDSPPGSFVQISVGVGSMTTCGLTDDGEVLCWGYALRGTLPAHTYVQVASGESFVCGRRSDSAMFCAGEWDIRHSVPTDFEVQDVVTMSAGRTHVCALKSDGSVACWGYDIYGETASPPVGNVFCANTPTPPPAE